MVQTESRRRIKEEIVTIRVPLKHCVICTNCTKPFNTQVPDHCRCIMWEVGKIEQEEPNLQTAILYYQTARTVRCENSFS